MELILGMFRSMNRYHAVLVQLQQGAGLCLGALWRNTQEGKYVTGPGSALNSVPEAVSGGKIRDTIINIFE